MKKIVALCLFVTCLVAAAFSLAEAPAGAVWIDVRSPDEYAQGHVAQARSIPLDSIEVGVAGLNLPKDAPIYLYCAKGGRAEAARQRLQTQGYSNVTNAGGLEQARQLAGDPAD